MGIVVPRKWHVPRKSATCEDRHFWVPGSKIHISVYRPNEIQPCVASFSGKRHGVSKPAGNIFRPISAGFGHFEVNFWPYPQIKISKNRFFSIFVKCFIYAIRYRIRVQNGFRTPRGSISGHISPIWPLWANIYKIEFFEYLALILGDILQQLHQLPHHATHQKWWL